MIKIPDEQLRIRDKCFHPTGRFEAFKQPDFEQSIINVFEKKVERFQDRLAVKTPQYSLSYRELNLSSNRIAHRIIKLRGTKHEPVALLFEPGVPFIQASIGILKAGKIQVPLDSSYPKARLTYILEQSKAAILVTNSKNLALAKEVSMVPVPNVDETSNDTSTENPLLSFPPERIVAIEYTSGSTGRPKGIVRTHRDLLHW